MRLRIEIYRKSDQIFYTEFDIESEREFEIIKGHIDFIMTNRKQKNAPLIINADNENSVFIDCRLLKKSIVKLIIK
jgi:hypothetical protein